jgi:hypothetical protein
MLITGRKTHDAAPKRPPRILSQAEAGEAIIADLIADDPMVLLGPCVTRPDDAKEGTPAHYFVVASGDHGEFFSSTLGAENTGEVDALRAMVLVALVQHSPPLTVFDLGDELQMAKLAEQLWPGPRITAIRRDIERERRRG